MKCEQEVVQAVSIMDGQCAHLSVKVTLHTNEAVCRLSLLMT